MSERMEVAVDGIQMVTTSALDDHRLPWLVMLHGLGCNKEDFRFLVTGLSKQFNCLAVNLPGHGESRRASKPGLDGLAGDLAQSLGSVFEGRQFALVGHSMGGLLGLKIAALLPAQLTGLAILDSNIPSTPSGRQRNLDDLRRLDERDWWEAYLTHMKRGWGVPDGSVEEHRILQTVGRIKQTVAARLWSDIRQVDGPGLWREVQHPLLYVRSSRDIDLSALETACPTATTADLLRWNLGHWPHVRAPERVLKELVPFLAGLKFRNPV